MRQSASARAFGERPSAEAEALTPSRLGPIAAEFLLIVAPATVLIVVLSAVLASRHLFLGNFGDTEQFLWIVDNLEEAVARGSAEDTRTFFGTPTPLAYNPVPLLIAIPTLAAYELSANYWFAYNFVYLSILLLNFCSMYIVLRLLRFDRSLSFAFASVFLLAPNTIGHSLGQIFLIATFLLPPYFYVLYRIKSEPDRVALWPALGFITGAYIWVREELGLFIVLSSLVFIVSCQPHRMRLLAPRVLLYLVIVATLALPVVAIYLQRTDFDQSHGVSTARALEEVRVYSSSPGNYLFPSDEGLVYQHLPVVFDQIDLAEHLNYLGIVNLVGLGAWLYFLLFRRDLWDAFLENSHLVNVLRWELLLFGLVFFILSLGPVLRLNDSDLKLPLYLGYECGLPVIESIRVWGRFGIFAFVPAIFLTAYLCRYLLTRTAGHAAIPLIAALIVIIAVLDQYPIGSLNFPRHKTEVPSAVSEIQADQGDFFVMDLPLALYSGAQHNSTPLFFQLFHDKRIVAGYTSVYHPLVRDRVQNSPLICFNYPEMVSVAADAPACGASGISSFLTDADIRYIVYHKRTPFYAPGYGPEIDATVREKSLAILNQLTATGAIEVIYEDGAHVFYRRAMGT